MLFLITVWLLPFDNNETGIGEERHASAGDVPQVLPPVRLYEVGCVLRMKIHHLAVPWLGPAEYRGILVHTPEERHRLILL